MSGNNRKKRPNNTNKPSNNQANNNIETVKRDVKETVAETKEDVKNIENNTKAQLEKSADKTTEKVAETSKKVEEAVTPNNNSKPTQKVNNTMDNPAKNQGNNSQADEKHAAQKNVDSAKKAETNPIKKEDVKKTTETTKTNTTTAPVRTAPAEKKSGGILAPLALIAGVAGTGIGVYNYDQVRKLNTGNQTTALAEQLKSIEGKVAELGGKNTDEVANQLKAQLAEINKTLKASQAKTNERLSAVEQTQNGLTKTLQEDVKETLDQRLNEVNDLLSKVDQIELTQKSISQNLTQAVAAGEAVTAEGMAKQEIGYLLRMADYKIQSEADAAGAAGLLEIAEKKLLLLNQGKTDNMVETIRQKYIQLQGVKSVDSNALISSLKKLSDIVPNLMPKPNESKPIKTEKSTAEEASSILGQVGDIIASGIEYTPNDPSKIDISAETVLIEKRLMQADIRTAELAVRSQNGVLLAETINSIRTNLDKYFADDATAKTIRSTLSNIEEQKLETVLPDLGPLVKQYEDR